MFVSLFFLPAVFSASYYDQSPYNLWATQLTLNEEEMTADFEFVLNTDSGKNLEYPKYFNLIGLKFSRNEDNLTFLNNPEDLDRADVKAMIEFFSPLGQFPTPVLTTVRDDTVYATILLVSAGMKRQDTRKNMKELVTKLEANKPSKRPQRAVESSTMKSKSSPIGAISLLTVLALFV